MPDAAAPPDYPPPPWHTAGYGVFVPFVFRLEDVAPRLPRAFRAQSVGGLCAGMLAYVRYEPPSPLSYDELLLITSMVRCEHPSLDRPARGYYVARMVVDSEASVAGGREIWGFPKDMAAFEHDADGTTTRCADGATVVLRHRRRRGPLRRIRLPVNQSMTTLQQAPDGRLIRFQSTMRGSATPARASLGRFAWTDDAWAPLGRAKAVPGAAVALEFDAVMGAPEVLVVP